MYLLYHNQIQMSTFILINSTNKGEYQMSDTTDLYINDNYELNSRLHKGSKIGVLSFCGVGGPRGGKLINEFGNTFKGKASIVFIKDTRRSWWNNGRFEDILDLAVRHLKKSGCKRIFAIGNSMGGCGALLAAHLRDDIEMTYAFVPQADPYHDIRWRHLTSRIFNIRWNDFSMIHFKSPIKIFMGDTFEDEHHRDAFQSANKDITFIKNAGHTAISILKERGEMPAIVEEFLK